MEMRDRLLSDSGETSGSPAGGSMEINVINPTPPMLPLDVTEEMLEVAGSRARRRSSLIPSEPSEGYVSPGEHAWDSVVRRLQRLFANE